MHIPSLSAAVRHITNELKARIWIMADEWSSIPDDMQPYLADVIRRVLFPNPDITVVIAAIEHRSRFQLSSGSNYTGIEIGADCSASINLDDFMVLENDPANSTDLFKAIIFRHLKNVDDTDLLPFTLITPDEMIRAAFTGKTFQELIRAAEGVPRDAINIVALAARRALNKKISIVDLRRAAAQWFTQDKSQFLKQNQDAEYLLAWIADRVIGQKRARAFLIESVMQSKLLDELYDGRLLHVLKRSVSAHDQPGKRYIAYKIDYGCYVDLLTTAKAPKGLLAGDEKSGIPFIDVPPDDYRSIRRSILNLNDFNQEKTREVIIELSHSSGTGKSAVHLIIEAVRNITVGNINKSARNGLADKSEAGTIINQSGVRSYFSPTDISAFDANHRNLRSKLVEDVMIGLMYANEDQARPIIYQDISDELGRLGLNEDQGATYGRIARLRRQGVVAGLDLDSKIGYHLTNDGRRYVRDMFVKRRLTIPPS